MRQNFSAHNLSILSKVAFWGIVLPLIGSVISVVYMQDWRLPHVHFHAALEIAGGVIALAVVLLIFISRDLINLNKNALVWIVTGLISMGILDLFHAVVEPGLSFVWFHSTATFAGGLFFMGVWLSGSLKLSLKSVPVVVFLSVVAFSIVSYVFEENLPAMIAENGTFTLSARLLNILGGAFYIVASVWFYKQFQKENKEVYLVLCAHCLLFGMAGILFETSVIWDPAWWWWHVLRLAAYLVLIKVFIENFKKEAVTLQSKIIFFTCLTTSVSAMLVGGLLYKESIEQASETQIKKINAEAKLLAPMFKVAFKELQDDTIFLSKMPPIQGMIRASRNNGIDPRDGSTTEVWKQRLQKIFKEMIDSREGYIQLRYIGLADKGRELVRVNKTGKMIVTVLEKDLQQKGNRDYITKARDLLPGETYISTINLNKEYGKIQKPYTPVIRVVHPVFDNEGVLFGFLVLNGAYEKIISRILDKIDINSNLFIINESGDYVYSERSGFNWKLYMKELGLKEEPSPIVKKVLESSKKAATWYQNVNGEETSAHFVKISLSETDKNRFVALALTRPKSEQFAAVGKAGEHAAFLLIILILLVSISSIVFSYQITQPLKQITEEVKSYNLGKEILKLPVQLNNEIGELARAFDTLTTDLSASEANANAVIDNSIDGIITIDEKGQILRFNPACEGIFGYKAKDVVGKNIKILMPASHAENHDSYLENYHLTGQSSIIGVNREFSGRRKDGTIFPIEISVNQMEVAGNSYYCGIVRDITERNKDKDNLLRANDELQHSNAELKRFAYIASHDLQEPLRKISSFTTRLEKALEGRLDNTEQKYMDFITSGANRMRDLIQGLLEYSRVTKDELEYEETDVNQAVSNALENLSSIIEENNATVQVDDLPSVYYGKSILTQIFQNLILNAIKYRSEEEPSIRISCYREENAWVLCIADNGMGMEEKYLDRIFEMFQRLHRKEEISGTGIGLSLCKKIIERYGGTIWVESEPGDGSSFFFTIPDLSQEMAKSA